MRKTLLSRKNIVKVIVTILVVVLVPLLFWGCSAYVEVYNDLYSQQQQKEKQKEKEAKDEQVSNYLEEIYNSYLEDDNEKLVYEFDIFLEENFGGKERLLNCLKRQKIYNDNNEDKNKIQEYLTSEEIAIFENCEDKIKELYEKYF